MPGIKKVKISSQKQIRIPTEYFERYGFADEARVSPTEHGIELRPPVEISNQGTALLEELIEQGLEGDKLVKEFRKRAKSLEASRTEYASISLEE